MLVSIPLAAKPLTSTRPATAPLARVVQLATLVDEPGKVRVAFVVVDHGGATDVSPTQTLHFTLYQKGEMFSADAAFDLGQISSFQSAKRAGPGKYAATVQVVNERGEVKPATLTVDAGAALLAMKNLKCAEETSCPEADKFQTKIELTTK